MDELNQINAKNKYVKVTPDLPLTEDGAIDFEACLTSSFQENKFDPYSELIDIANNASREENKLRAILKLADIAEARSEHGPKTQPIIINQINPEDILRPPEDYSNE